jgi:hypothetical protein
MKYKCFALFLLSVMFCSKNDTEIKNNLLGNWVYLTKDTINLSDTLIYVRFDTTEILFDESRMIFRRNYHLQSLDSLKGLPSNFVITFIIPPPPFEYLLLDNNFLELNLFEYLNNGNKSLISKSFYRYSITNDSLHFYYESGDSIKLDAPDSLLDNFYLKQ